MKIDRENCEAWFLDYYEGVLDSARTDKLFAFLAANPDLQEVFDGYDEVSFSPDSQINFSGKDDLKKTVEAVDGISESNYQEYFIGEIEGVLDASEKKELEKFLIQFPEKRKELEVFRLTVLKVDEKIVFENKSSLKKSVLITDENFEEMAIASVEGLLNAEEENSFATFIAANAERKKAIELFTKTKLVADGSVVFEDKQSLKRKENDRGILWWMLDIRFAAAAAVALLIGIFFWQHSEKNSTMNEKPITKIDISNKNKNNVPNVLPNDSATDSLKNVATNNTHHKGVIIPINIHVKNENNIATNNTHHKGAIIPISIHVKNENVIAQNTRHKNSIISIAIHAKDGSSVAQENFSHDAIAFNDKEKMLNTSNEQQVDFSGAYYDAIQTSSNAKKQSDGISPGQFAMRWMKNKLDHSANKNEDDDAVYTAVAQNKNKEVTGFDLTSSAVNAIGEATGSNLHLAHENDRTVLTVGKYKLLLN